MQCASKKSKETEKSFDLKEGNYRDGIKRKETRQGWMDGCCHGDNLRILLINRHKRYIFKDRLLVCYDNIGQVPIDK